MLENEIKIYKADAEESIEAKMAELAEVEIVYQSKSASADITSTKMTEQTSLLRQIFKLIFLNDRLNCLRYQFEKQSK